MFKLDEEGKSEAIGAYGGTEYVNRLIKGVNRLFRTTTFKGCKKRCRKIYLICI
jgi:hypothetical protein